MTKVHLTK